LPALSEAHRAPFRGAGDEGKLKHTPPLGAGTSDVVFSATIYIA